MCAQGAFARGLLLRLSIRKVLLVTVIILAHLSYFVKQRNVGLLHSYYLTLCRVRNRIYPLEVM